MSNTHWQINEPDTSTHGAEVADKPHHFMAEALCYGFLCTETGKTKRKISSGIEICATPLGCCPVETHICQTSANAKEDLGFPHCVCQ